MNGFSAVIPTIGRPSLAPLLRSLASVPEVVVVDDRRFPHPPLDLPPNVRLLRTWGRGPAAARNVGWRATTSQWVVFLDDDIEVTDSWLDDLRRDLDACGADTGGVQARIEVPFPGERAPTDWERNVAGLADARWVTADMAYRRRMLERLGGFDERFRRAYREDSDLALRAEEAGWKLVRGRRRILHPVRPAGWWVSVRSQRGNRDDVLMRRLHGRDWRERAGAGPGMADRHLLTASLAVLAVAGAATGRRTPRTLGAAGWLASTIVFAWRRIRPGPRHPAEIARMATTSAVIPLAATAWRAAGLLLDRGKARQPDPAESIEAVLFDRDGTLVVDVPYNGDPASVRLVPGAEQAVTRLRAAGLRLGLVTNQSGIGRGMIAEEQVDAVHRRLESLLGPFDTIVYCPHRPEDQCRCRKPAPGLIFEAARRLGVDPRRCVVVGDILGDVLAAEAAGSRAVLVPNAATRPREASAVPHVAADMREAVDLVLSWRRG